MTGIERAGFLPSVLTGSISLVAGKVLNHFLPSGRVLDMTARTQAFWRNVNRPDVVSCWADKAYFPGLTLVSDCQRAPLRDGCMESLVFDPPWQINEAANKKARCDERYSTFARHWTEVVGLAAPNEWHRVTTPGAILILRIADCHHAGKFIPFTDLFPEHLRPWWNLWDRVIHVHHAFGAQTRMKPPAKTRKLHAEFQIYHRAE